MGYVYPSAPSNARVMSHAPLNIIQNSIQMTALNSQLYSVHDKRWNMAPPELPFVEFIPHAAFKEDMRRGGKGLLRVKTFRS